MATTFPARAILMMNEYSRSHALLGTEAPFQTFPYGNLVSPVNGLYTETPVGTPAATARNKLAMAAGQNNATPPSRLPYVDPWSGMVFAVTLAGTPTLAQLFVGTRYGLNKDAATGFHGALLSDTTNAVWELVQLDGNVVRRGVPGVDTNLEVYARLLAI